MIPVVPVTSLSRRGFWAWLFYSLHLHVAHAHPAMPQSPHWFRLLNFSQFSRDVSLRFESCDVWCVGFRSLHVVCYFRRLVDCSGFFQGFIKINSRRWLSKHKVRVNWELTAPDIRRYLGSLTISSKTAPVIFKTRILIQKMANFTKKN